jgi:predicted Zn finger-like uncharacterized protein
MSPHRPPSLVNAVEITSDIFISYKREEHRKASTLAAAFKDFGWTVWWDRDLQAGDHFESVIKKRIHSTRVVIVLWSARSACSKHVIAEASLAGRLKKLVPVLIEKVVPPAPFKDLHTIDISERRRDSPEGGVGLLLDELKKRLGPVKITARTISDSELQRQLGTERRRLDPISDVYLSSALGTVATDPGHFCTRCSGCATIFRISAGQIGAKAGNVRCGACGTVFNALDALVRVEESDVIEEVPLRPSA